MTVRPLIAPVLLMLGALAVVGCGGKPSKANIELRKQNDELKATVARLESERAGDKATIASLQSGATTVPSLPQERIDELYSVTGLKLGSLTGVADLDPAKPGDDGIKIYVVPRDASNDALKAAGTFVVEAFDLSATEPRIGSWTFTPAQAKQHWISLGWLYEYVLPCPLEKMPGAKELTIKVTFTDALTQRVFTEQKLVRLNR